MKVSVSENRKWMWQVDIGDDWDEFGSENPYTTPQAFYFRDAKEMMNFLELMVVTHEKMAMVQKIEIEENEDG